MSTRISTWTGSLALILAAACAPAAEQAAVPAIDSAAVNAGLDGLRTAYIAAETGGDAAALAALYTEDAVLDFQGAPRATGRAAVQAMFTGLMATMKTTVLEINPDGRFPRSNDAAGEIGTYHSMADSSGTMVHAWGRYAGSYRKDADGTWRIAYLIAFPDSNKTDKK